MESQKWGRLVHTPEHLVDVHGTDEGRGSLSVMVGDRLLPVVGVGRGKGDRQEEIWRTSKSKEEGEEKKFNKVIDVRPKLRLKVIDN